jgi:hypothetical protein
LIDLQLQVQSVVNSRGCLVNKSLNIILENLKDKTRSNNVIEQDDYETYKRLVKTYDPITQFAFNEDINIDKLTDNR